MYTYTSNSELTTINLAKKIATKLAKKDVIVLTGDLGSGKTKFTQGILEYFGLENEISSPTFTIVNEYPLPLCPLYHFDVYRLHSIEEFYAIGGDEYFENGICIIEWGEIIQDALPNNYLQIEFRRTLENENIRVLNFTPFGKINPELLNLLERIEIWKF